MDKNIKKAHEYCAYAANCGVIPLAPHTIFTNYLDDQRPEERQRGLDMGIELLTRCDELWVMGNRISEGMQGEIDYAKDEHIPVFHLADELIQSGYKIRQEDEAFSYKDCIPGSGRLDYTNQILVLNPEEYNSEDTLGADYSLWIARTGFGCRPESSGRAVYADNLLTGASVRWNRSDFCGIVEPLRLYEWLSDKPVMNERADEIVREVEAEISGLSAETEAEAEL